MYQIIATLRDHDGDVQATAGHLQVNPRLVDAALAYYAEFTDEVDSDSWKCIPPTKPYATGSTGWDLSASEARPTCGCIGSAELGAYPSARGSRRSFLICPRRFLASIRRRRAALDGRVGRRRFGGMSASASSPASRRRAA